MAGFDNLENTNAAEAIEKTAASEQLEEKILNEKIKVMERLLNEAQEERNLGMVDYFRDRIAEFRGELNEISAKNPEEASNLEAQSKIEKFTRLQQEAKTEGNTAMADYYGGLIKDIRDAIKGRPPRPVATGHQGRQLEKTSDPEKLGYHQGKQTEQISKPGEAAAKTPESTKSAEELRNQFRTSSEVSFGNSDLKSAKKKMESAGGWVDLRQKHLLSDIRFNRDTTQSKSDLKFAQKQYASAVKEYNELVKESKKGK